MSAKVTSSRNLPFLFCLAVGLWLVIFSPFLTRMIGLSGDTLPNYCILKFYFNNLLNGVFPLWDPYVYLGRPFLYMASSGALNPFAYLIPTCVSAGLDYYSAYLAFIVLYFLFGVWGFYRLVLFLFGPFEAFLGAVALLFSGVGAVIFTQIFILYLFVPCVWFFVFFLRFFKEYRRSDFIGLLFFLMLMNVSYIPFYFLTLFLITVLFSCAIFPDIVGGRLGGLVAFFKRFPSMIALAVVGLLISAMPLLIFNAQNSEGEFISPARHMLKTSQESKSGEDAQMDLVNASWAGNLAERIKGGRMFSGLDHYSYFHDDFFYIPSFIWLAAAMALFAWLGRRQCLVFEIGLVLFLISMGAATELYKFLFEWIFYFKFYRNLFFYMAFLMPLFILFSVSQLGALLKQYRHMRLRLCLAAVVIHAGASSLLALQGDILPVTYATVVLSFLFFLFVSLGKLKAQSLAGMVILASLIIAEPVVVFLKYQAHAEPMAGELPIVHKLERFSYTRPRDNMVFSGIVAPKLSGYVFLLHMADLKDTNGAIIKFPDLIAKDLYRLLSELYKEDYYGLVAKKFWLYDRVKPWEGMETFRESLKKGANTAYVIKPDPKLEALKSSGAERPVAIENDSSVFRIRSFNANHLEWETDFSEPKFLVYTTALNSAWHLYHDGRPESVYKAQGAFTGVLVPQGKSHYKLVYEPAGRAWPYVATIFAFFLVLGLFLVYYWRDQREFGALKPPETEPVPLFKRLRQGWVFYLTAGLIICLTVDFRVVHFIRLGFLKGSYYLTQKRPNEAVNYFDYRVHDDPTDHVAYIGLAQNYFRMGEYAKAYRAYQSAAHLCKEKGLDQKLEPFYKTVIEKSDYK